MVARQAPPLGNRGGAIGGLAGFDGRAAAVAHVIYAASPDNVPTF